MQDKEIRVDASIPSLKPLLKLPRRQLPWQIAYAHHGRHRGAMCRTLIVPPKALPPVRMEGSESTEQLLHQLSADASDARRRLAVAKITELARTTPGRRSVVNAGGTARLVGVLKGRSSVLRCGAAHALCNLANDRENHNEIVKQGAVKAFVQLLHEGSREGVCAGAVNLANLSRNPMYVKTVLMELGGPSVLAGLLKTWDFCSARDVCADLLVRLSSSKVNEGMFLAEEGMEALITVFMDATLSIESREKILTALFNALLNKQEHLE